MRIWLDVNGDNVLVAEAVRVLDVAEIVCARVVEELAEHFEVSDTEFVEDVPSLVRGLPGDFLKESSIDLALGGFCRCAGVPLGLECKAVERR